jgi:hypothetical protein
MSVRIVTFFCCILVVASLGIGPSRFADGANIEPPQSLVSVETRMSVSRGLKFLLKAQQPDGSFHHERGIRIGITGLCGLALREASGGSKVEEQQLAVERAVRFLSASRDDKGIFRDADIANVTANHAFATLFLARVHRSTGERLVSLKVVERACDALILGQNEDGGWNCALDGSASGDVSNTACVLAALDACREIEIGIPQETWIRAQSFAETCRTSDGGYGHRPFAPASNPACTANGDYCVVAAEAGCDSKESASSDRSNARRENDRLLRASPNSLYGEFFSELAKRRSAAGIDRRDAELVSDDLIRRQRADGAWDDVGGSAFGTAVAVRILQTCRP